MTKYRLKRFVDFSSYSLTIDEIMACFEPVIDYKEIITTNTDVIKVDSKDYDELNKYPWYVNNSGYAYRGEYSGKTGTSSQISMSRQIMGVLDKDWHQIQVDHINHDPLDNRRSNLRIVNNQQNAFNREKHIIGTSKYKGVSWCKGGNGWKAQIILDGEHKSIQIFDSELEAARFYDEKAKEFFGKYAVLNFPIDDHMEDALSVEEQPEIVAPGRQDWFDICDGSIGSLMDWAEQITQAVNELRKK